MNIARMYRGFGTQAMEYIGQIKETIEDLSVYPRDGWVLCNEENNLAYGVNPVTGKDIVPNLCGYFLRGWSEEVGQEYPGSPARYNEFQDQAIMAHDHRITRSWGGTPGTSMFGAPKGENNSAEANTELEGGPENRPKNFAVAYIIKVS